MKRTIALGYTLIELLVAMALGIILSAGIVNVYIDSKKSFWQDEEIARVQENGRYAIHYLLRELRMAGFIGGVSDYSDIVARTLTTDCGPSGDNWGTDLSTTPFEIIDQAQAGSITTSYSCVTGGTFVSDTDVLVVKRTSDTPILENGVWETGYSALVADRLYIRTNNRGLGLVSLSLGSDIDTSDSTIVASNQADAAANPENGTLVDIWEYYASVIHLANDSDGMPSLARYSIDGTGDFGSRQIMVRGIEDLQIELGIDTDDDGAPNRFVAASTNPPITTGTVVTPGSVVSANVYVLVRSEDTPASAESRSVTYQLGDATVTKTDNIYRRVFSGNVQLRNTIYTVDD